MIIAPLADFRKLELRLADVTFTLVYLDSPIMGSALVGALTNVFKIKKLSLGMNCPSAGLIRC
jgi:hypothetical protein